MILQKVEQAINDQIKLEEFSSRLYMAMACWCDANGYPGAAKFLHAHSDEERIHMLKFVKYLSDRGSQAKLAELEQPENSFNNIKELFEEIYKHEQLVTASINNLVALSMEEKDFGTQQFLQWFVGEQVEEESLFSEILDKLNLVGTEKGGMYHLDKELEAKAGPSMLEQATTAV